MIGRIKPSGSRRCLASLGGVLAMAVAVVAAASPPWFSRTWLSDVGLPDNTVMGIDQTPDGFLWVATQTGLVRFDGVQFRQFPLTAASAPTAVQRAMLADRRGRLWVAVNRRTLVCLDPGRPTTVFDLEKGRPDKGTGMMVEDRDGAVWVSYVGGELYRIEDGQARLFTADDGLPENGDCQFAVDRDGQLWFCRTAWVGVFRDGKFRSLAPLAVPRITAARAGGIWGYEREQIWKFAEGGTPQAVGKPPPALATASPTVLLEDRAGRLLIGTSEAGLFCYDGKDFTTVPTPHRTILSLKEDREGNLWVGTRGGGLNQLKPRVVELLTTGSGTPLEAVRSVCQDTAGVLWAVVWQKGELLRNAGQVWAPMSAADGWPFGNAQCVAADPRGGVWIGTQNNGVLHWQNGAITEGLDESSGLGSNRVNALLTTPTGELWISNGFPEAPSHFLQRRRAGQLRSFTLPAGSGPVVVLTTDAAGDCWAATFRGRLLRIHDDVLTDETRSTPAAAGAIRCLLGTPDGSLWIGYGGHGLGRLKAGHFSRTRMEQGLHDDYISNILTDGRGRLWCAGNRGIFNVLETDLDALAAGRVTHLRTVAYGKNDGLPGLQASYDSWPGALRSADGRLLFAMQSGVAVVYPDEPRKIPAPPPVAIESATVNGKLAAAYGADGFAVEAPAAAPLELGQGAAHLHLSRGQRQVEFAFTAPSFIKPEGIEFKYRLIGMDGDWVMAGMRRLAAYPQLPPGHYRFEVSACNLDGVWNTTPAALDLTVQPYWWETAWFRVIGPLSVAILLGGGILFELRRRHRHQIERLELLRATERERVRIARDLHDDLGGGLTEIAMLSEVARQPCARPHEVSGHLARIFQSSREMTRALDEIVWAVNPANDTLEKLISFASEFAREILAPTGTRYRLDVSTAVPALSLNSQLRHHLCMALKECLHNIVKHARAEEVRVRIGLHDRTLEVCIEDNGVGFDQTELKHQTGTHNGLGNLRQRMAAIGGTCDIQSVPGQGTCIKLETRI